jgi:hypothetical protein
MGRMIHQWGQPVSRLKGIGRQAARAAASSAIVRDGLAPVCIDTGVLLDEREVVDDDTTARTEFQAPRDRHRQSCNRQSSCKPALK